MLEGKGSCNIGQVHTCSLNSTVYIQFKPALLALLEQESQAVVDWQLLTSQAS